VPDHRPRRSRPRGGRGGAVHRRHQGILMAPATEGAAPLIFIIAGEPSGDALGAKLMHALKDATGGAVRFAGVGGDRMSAEGLRSLFPLHDIAVMGITEILPQVPTIFRRLNETVAAVRAQRPAVLVTIDAPAFV